MNQLFRILCLLSFAITMMAEEINFEQLLRDSSNNLTAKMFHEVAKSNVSKNVVLSAFSVMPPLAQLALASLGESHDELLDSIGMPNDDITKAVFSFANTKLRSTKGVILNLANKIYVAENYELNTDFAAISRDTFGSEVKNINFLKKHEAADEVNAWVEDQTNHRIKNLVQAEKLKEETRALLVNAIYFKGTWKETFDKDATIERNFNVNKDKVIRVPTMHRKGHYKYSEDQELNAQLLEIPYEGDESSFLIILPRDIDGINELEEKLEGPTILDKAINNLRKREVEVYIPKFKIETTTDLKDILEKINVTKIFTPGSARLEKLLKSTGSLYIEGAVQKAFIEVNEEGAEAAAANVFYVAEITSVSLIRRTPPVFNADRPFYFAVKLNSIILFNGVVRKP